MRIALAALLCLAAGAEAQLYRDFVIASADDVAPGTIFVSPTEDLSLQGEPVRGMEDRTLRVPAGFHVSAFATDIGKARLMAWGPDSVLHVASMSTNRGSQWSPDPDTTSRVLALPDRDHDGRADTVLVAADGFLWPNDVAFFRGAMYVADTHQIVRLHDDDGDGYYEKREVFIDNLASFSPGISHVTHSLLFDEARGILFVHQGSSCDLCREDDRERATITAFDLDGSNRRVWATGLRNAIGYDLHPVTGELWTNSNGHDRDRFPDGRNMPPEYVGIVREGSFHGWPLAFGFRTWVDFSVDEYRREVFPLTRQDTLLVDSIQRPVVMLPGHTGPMALHFYTSDRFGPRLRNAAFIALRAGNRGVSDGYKVVAVLANDDGTNGRVADFLTGFRPDPASSDVWGQPVGLESDSRGNLYVSSDRFTQAIFRVTAGPLLAQWGRGLPDSVLAGQRIAGEVALTRVAPDGDEPTLSADLSDFGGVAEVPLRSIGDGRFRFEGRIGDEVAVGPAELRITVRQSTPSGPLTISLSRRFIVLPSRDLVLLGDELGRGWASSSSRGAEALAIDGGGPVFAGQSSAAITAAPLRRSRVWLLEFQPTPPILTLGYRALRFAFHPGDVEPQEGDRFDVNIRSRTTRTVSLLVDAVRDYGLDLARKEWQTIEIPLQEFGEFDGPVELVSFSSNLAGTMFIDEVRLVVSAPPITAVLETRSDAVPQSVSLEQNYPNPFNHETVIRFALPSTQRVVLDVYNLTGQRVTTLLRGLRTAGTYQVRWDGRDAGGQSLASGIYLYRLRAGRQVMTRKLLLLQ